MRKSQSEFAPVVSLLMLAAILASAGGGLHHVQTLREQARRTQCTSGIKHIRLALTGFRLADSHQLSAPALIESCLAELEANDA